MKNLPRKKLEKNLLDWTIGADFSPGDFETGVPTQEKILSEIKAKSYSSPLARINSLANHYTNNNVMIYPNTTGTSPLTLSSLLEIKDHNNKI